MSARARAYFILAALAMVGCQRAGDASPVRATAAATEQAGEDTSYRTQPGYVIDSILPPEEALRRFRAGIDHVPAQFEGGASSRDALAHAFAQALEGRDTVALHRLRIDRGEFAYLVYPGSANSRPPYRQSPDVVWLQLTLASDKGLRRLLARRAGVPMKVDAVACPTGPKREGNVRLWHQCTIRYTSGSDTLSGRLFGAIVERDGRYKFASYANQL